MIPNFSDTPEAENSDLKKLGSLMDDQQAEINRWLESESPVLHELYCSLCALIYGKRIPGRVRLVAHCIREIRNVLLWHLVAKESNQSQLQYPEEIDSIAEDWEKIGLNFDNLKGEHTPTPTSTNANIQIRLDLAMKIQRLIKKHNSIRAINSKKIIRLFEYFQKTNLEGVTSLKVLADNWKSLTKRFVSISHERRHTDDKIMDDEFVKKVQAFEQSLYYFATAPAFFKGLKEIDDILEQANTCWSKPTPEQVDAAIRRLIHVGQIRYFFDGLKNPNWVEPLWNEGFFKNPPPSIPGEEENTIAFPIWPESKFLVRMAEHVPDLVCQIIEKMPSTENAHVLEDFIDATLAMPVPIAMRLLPKIKDWSDDPYRLLYYGNLGGLVASFAKAGKTKPALNLIKKLFAIEPPPSKKCTLPDGSEIEVGREPVARMDIWQYEHALKKCLPPLTSAAGIDTLRLLCGLTEAAIRFRDSNSKRDDYLTSWRPAVEDHEQNTGHTLKDTLIDAVRDAAMRIVSEGPANLEQVVTTLEKRRFAIFSRIALHVLAENEVVEPKKLIAERLLNRKLFESSWHRHEYAHLLRAKFKFLDADGQALIVQWIEDGPDLAAEHMRDNQGRPATEKEVQRVSDIWKRDRISWFLESAPQCLKDIYDQVVATEGEPEHANFSSFRTVWMGPTSPKTVEELREYEFDQLIEYLRNWKPTNDWRDPSREGLRRVLEALVIEKNQEFSEKADRLKDLPAIYLGGVVSGLTKAIFEEATFGWAAIFELLDWILAQEDESDPTAVYDDNILSWQVVRQGIARLLEKGFIKNRIPFELREQVWGLVKRLTNDPDPTLEDEARYGGDSSVPWDMARNTVRGLAFHVVIQYGLWCLRAGKKRGEGDAAVFSGTPEVTEILGRHLDPKVDSSLAVRSVYGRFFPWIMLLDRAWAEANVGKIFPTATAEASFWNAGWGGYILFVQPFDEVLDLLCDRYDFAIEALTEVEGRQQRDGKAERLASHLMAYYWRGKLDNKNGKALLEKFWLKAPPETRSAALRFVGLSLKDLKKTKENLPEEVTSRLVTLWESRVRAFEEADEKDRNPVELDGFGWWMTSDALPNDWALEQLSQVLSLTNAVERETDILTKLVNLFAGYPHKTAGVFEKVLNGTEKTWGISLIREDVRELLRRMLDHEDKAIVDKARELIDFLGVKGHPEFRDLLKAPGLAP